MKKRPNSTIPPSHEPRAGNTLLHFAAYSDTRKHRYAGATLYSLAGRASPVVPRPIQDLAAYHTLHTIAGASTLCYRALAFGGSYDVPSPSDTATNLLGPIFISGTPLHPEVRPTDLFLENRQNLLYRTRHDT